MGLRDCPLCEVEMARKPKSEQDGTAEIERLRRKVSELSAANKDLRDTIAGLRSGDEFFRALVSTSSTAVTITDLEGNITHVSKITLKLHGYDSADEMLGMSAFDLIAPEDAERAREGLKATLETGMVQDLEYNMLRRDGSTFVAELNASVVADSEGAPYAFAADVRDITERRRVENALRASEEKYRELVENINDAIYTIDADGILTYVSPAVETMLGYRPSELIGRKFTEHMFEEDVDRALGGMHRVMRGQLQPNIARARTRSGELRWMRASSRPVYVDGKPAGIQGVLTDVTERRKAEERANFLGSITERLRDAVIVTDADFKIVYVNKAAEDLFGYSAKEMSGKYSIVLAADSGAGAVERAVETAKSGRVWEGTFACRRKDGSMFLNELRISPLEDDTGRITHFVGTQRDVTDKSRLEQEYRQAQKMEAVGKMAGGMAHDFNNVLTAIIGYSELLLQSCEPGSTMREDVEQIGRTAKRAAELTRRLLSFSRKEAMQVSPVDLTTLVKDLDGMIRRLMGEPIDYVSHLSPDLKRMNADAGQIEQVVMNLAVNARDAMAYGGRLTIRTDDIVLDEEFCRDKPNLEPGHYVMLEVADTGTGMDADVKEHIFEPFYTTKEVGKGSGLGLSVVYGVVNQHDGCIEVESEPGEGTTVRVYFPAASTAAAVESPEEPEEPSTKGDGKRVLLVEDQEEVRKLAKRALTNSGFVVLPAVDAASALEVFERERRELDVVFSDVVLPDRSGFELADEMRAKDPEVPILLTSGYSDQELPWSEIGERGYFFLEKPYDLGAMVRAVGRCLATRRKK